MNFSTYINFFISTEMQYRNTDTEWAVLGKYQNIETEWPVSKYRIPIPSVPKKYRIPALRFRHRGGYEGANPNQSFIQEGAVMYSYNYIEDIVADDGRH